MRTTARPKIGGVRDLTAADLVSELRPGGAQASSSGSNLLIDAHASTPPPPSLVGLERLRALHHRIARTLAGFDGNVAAASAVLGLDPSRITALKSNPAFIELVAMYRDRTDEIILDLRARMELLAYDTLAELHERLIGDPDSAPTNRELIDMTRELLDRLGHAPVQRGVVANVNLGQDDLAKLFGAAQRVKVLEDVREAMDSPTLLVERESGPDE